MVLVHLYQPDRSWLFDPQHWNTLHSLRPIRKNMTTRRANLRKGNSGTGKTVAKSSNTRAKRKAATEKKMAAAVASAKPAKTAAPKAVKKAAPKKAAPAKAAKAAAKK